MTLKPCPFCGSADLVLEDLEMVVRCTGCDTRHGNPGAGLMPPHWNTRADMPKLPPRYELIAEGAKCRDCADFVHDYYVSGKLWLQVIGSYDGVWCWDCFADRADRKGVDYGIPVLLTFEEVDAVVAIDPHIFGKE